MKIAVLKDGWWPQAGGGEVHVKELSIALANQFDHQIDVYTRAFKYEGVIFDKNEKYVDGKVRIKKLPPATGLHNPVGRLSYILNSVKAIQQANVEYEIIHGHTYLPAIPTYILSNISDTPSVFTVHGTAVPSGVGLTTNRSISPKRLLEKLLVYHFNYNVVVSVNHNHRDILDKYHDEIKVIPNGVDVDRFFSPNVQKERRILYVGRLSQKKRVIDLINAFARICENPTFESYHLDIVGTGPKQGKLRQSMIENDLSKRVSFHGYVPDSELPEYYARSELFVLPSIWEGHPLTLLEAWAAGTTVIATRVEGIEEFINHEKTGYLVNPKSPIELAETMKYALQNPEERKDIIEKAQNLVKNEYTWNHAAVKTNSIYEDLTYI